MTGRVLIVPAAGLGSRLGADLPKPLVAVAGEPMIDRVLRLYDGHVDAAVLVVHPRAEATMREHVGRSTRSVRLAVQDSPTGMLDAILLATPDVAFAAPEAIWITWCDQVAVRPETVRRLAAEQAAQPAAALVMPTVQRADPYIHLARDASGRIVRVLHRREGDAMPARGESDMGLFALSAGAFFEMLPAYAAAVEAGASTGERNFLPFIAWAAARSTVVTFPAIDPMEAVGVNTPQELKQVEDYLATRRDPS